MTNQQLMDENEILRDALQKIIRLTDLKPIPGTIDTIYYDNRKEFMAARLGRICAMAEMALNHCDE